MADALRALEQMELELARLSRPYKDQLEVQGAELATVHAALPPHSALLEFKQYQVVDFDEGELGEARFAGLFLEPTKEPQLVDLGPAADIAAHFRLMSQAKERAVADRAAGQTLPGPVRGFRGQD